MRRLFRPIVRPSRAGRSSVSIAVLWSGLSVALAATAGSPSLSPASPRAAAGEHLVVGSKRFTESYILGEIVARTAQRAGADAVHRPGLGNTAVVLEALKTGDIDVYPEYRGTIQAEILHHATPVDDETLRRELAALGLAMDVPLGFSNGYALATTAAQATALSLRTLGDLRTRPSLPIGLSHEFLGRRDGWPGLAARYGLPQRPVGIDHGVAYDALAAGRIAATDIYTTDAKIAALGLVVLQDDRGYFPRYDAVLLHRLDLPSRAPATWAAVRALAGRIDVARMIAMNGEAELQGRTFAAIAASFVDAEAAARAPGGAPAAAPASPASLASLASSASMASMASSASTSTGAAPAGDTPPGVWARLLDDDLGRLTREHLTLVLLAVGLATLVGLPLGALAAARPRLFQPVMAVVGLLQTVPSLALLAALIPLFGRIGAVPALAALSLYALLPIVRNAATGLQQVPTGLRLAGAALGLTPAQRWRHVDLPLAAPVILAGIKTSAVVTVGTTTIAAFIGAGGYGERIAKGLALNDHAVLLAGAIPSAVLALAMQGLFEGAERWAARRR